MYGGDGNDRIQGGNVSTIFNPAGVLHEYGGDGDDAIEDGGILITQSHVLDGGPGRDALYGSLSNDTLYGGDGDDQGSLLPQPELLTGQAFIAVSETMRCLVVQEETIFRPAPAMMSLMAETETTRSAGDNNDILSGDSGADLLFGDDGTFPMAALVTTRLTEETAPTRSLVTLELICLKAMQETTLSICRPAI